MDNLDLYFLLTFYDRTSFFLLFFFILFVCQKYLASTYCYVVLTVLSEWTEQLCVYIRIGMLFLHLRLLFEFEIHEMRSVFVFLCVFFLPHPLPTSDFSDIYEISIVNVNLNGFACYIHKCFKIRFSMK